MCGSWDDVGRLATFGLTFTTHLNTDGPWSVGGKGYGSPVQCRNGLASGSEASGTLRAVSGTSSGGAGGSLLYLSGFPPDTVLKSLCFQWNVSP